MLSYQACCISVSATDAELGIIRPMVVQVCPGCKALSVGRVASTFKTAPRFSAVKELHELGIAHRDISLAPVPQFQDDCRGMTGLRGLQQGGWKSGQLYQANLSSRKLLLRRDPRGRTRGKARRTRCRQSNLPAKQSGESI